MSREIVLKEIGMPSFTAPGPQPRVSRKEYEQRLTALEEAAACDVVAVYGDREHFANLAYLCGFDPRFEEALLVVGRGRRRLLVGNEGLVCTRLLPVQLDVVHVPSFSLMGQDRSGGQTLRTALTSAVSRADCIGIAGWKSLNADEWDLPDAPIAAPAFLVDLFRALVSKVIDVTPALTDPVSGLRATNSADALAAFEWAAARASTAVAGVVGATRPGMLERDAVRGMSYAGDPLSAHVMFSSGEEVDVGLRSPTDRELELGDAVTTAIGFWGGLCCRAALLATDESELRPQSRGYLDEMAIPYWRAISSWYESLQLGVTGDELDRLVRDVLAEGGFGPALNPGHLTHLDEWVHSPIRPGSNEIIRSGMALQCDVIPDNTAPGRAANCEDSLGIADAILRRELEERHPNTWERIVARRAFMQRELGIRLAPEVLPFSSLPAYFPPFWLAQNRALAYG
jgi:Xaa-Pro aminopeptidase